MEKAVCQNPEDPLTSAMTALLDSFKGIIRETHKASNLPGAVSSLQTFLDDMLATARQTPTPSGFFDLCLKHQGDLHVFLHDLCANSPQLVEAYSKWYSSSTILYQRDKAAPLGSFTKLIDDLLSIINTQDREAALHEADQYAAFSQASEQLSRQRLQAVLQGSPSDCGPGTATMVWHDLINKFAVRPATMDGPCRFGEDASVQNASKESEEVEGGTGPVSQADVAVLPTPEGRPQTTRVQRLLSKFYELLARNRVISL